MIRRFRSIGVRARRFARFGATTLLALLAVIIISVLESHGVSAQAAPTSVLGDCPNQTALNELPHIYCSATLGWLDSALLNAQRFFTILVGIEFAWTAILWAFQKENLGELVSALVIKTMGIAFFYFILLNRETRDFLPKIMMSFMQLGTAVTGRPVDLNNPTGIVEIGISICQQVFNHLPWANFYISIDLSKSIYDDLFMALCMLCAGLFAIIISFVVFMAFLIAAGQLIMTLIEAYIMIAGGAIMLGFTGSRWTMSFGEKWFGYAFAIGVKLFVLSLIIGLGVTLFPAAGTTCTDGSGGDICTSIVAIGKIKFYHASDISLLSDMVIDYLKIGASAVIFMMLTQKLPGLAASMMNGSPSLTMGSAMGTFSAVGGAVMGGLSAATSTAMGTLNGVMGAATGVMDAGMNTANTLMDNAKEAAMTAATGGMGGGAEAAGGAEGGGMGAMMGGGGGAEGAEGGGGGLPGLDSLPGLGGGSGGGGGAGGGGGLPGMDKNSAVVVAKGFAQAGSAVAGGAKDVAFAGVGGAKDMAMAAASPLMNMDEGGGGGSVAIGLKMPE